MVFKREEDMELKNPDIRKLKDIKTVLFNDKIYEPEKEIYYMYRGLKKDGNLRYDITVVPSLIINEEYIKTKGHFHKQGHPEIYTVLEGEAIFLMQKGIDPVEDIYIIKAKKGDSAIIPPLYGHITINPSKETLKMANWVSDDCLADYEPIENKKGSAYFYTLNGWIKNNNYKEVPKIREEKPTIDFPRDLGFLDKI